MIDSIQTSLMGALVAFECYVMGDYDEGADITELVKSAIEAESSDNLELALDYTAQCGALVLKGKSLPEEVMGDLSALSISHSELDDLKVAVITEEGEPPNQPELFGIDVSNSKILRESGVEGERLIAAFGYHGKFIGNAVNFVRALLK
jgi:hypothetical protein